MSSSIFNRPPGTPLTASRSAQRSAAADVCGSACHKGLSPDTPRSALDVLTASGSHTSPTLSPAFVAPASSASSSSCNANLTCRPVHELVAMIYNERKTTVHGVPSRGRIGPAVIKHTAGIERQDAGNTRPLPTLHKWQNMEMQTLQGTRQEPRNTGRGTLHTQQASSWLHAVQHWSATREMCSRNATPQMHSRMRARDQHMPLRQARD